MKLNQTGSMALPLALIVSGILAGTAYYNSKYSGVSSKAVYTDVDQSQVGDSLVRHLNKKTSALKFKIGSLLAGPGINATEQLTNVLTDELQNDDNFKCQRGADINNEDHHIITVLNKNEQIVMICNETTLNDRLGYLVSAYIKFKDKLDHKFKKSFVAARPPVGYITLSRGEPQRDNQFLRPYIAPEKLEKKMPVYLHDKITTNATSFAHITMLDDTILNLGPNSEFQIDSFEIKDQTDVAKRTGIYNLINGFLRANFTKRSENNLTVKTKTAAMGVRGTTFTVWTGILPNGQPASIFTLLEGKIEILENDGTTSFLPAKKEMDAGTGGETPNFVNVQASKTDPKVLLMESGQLTKEQAKKYDEFGDVDKTENQDIQILNAKIIELKKLESSSLDERFTQTPEWKPQIVQHPKLIEGITDVKTKHDGDDHRRDGDDDDDRRVDDVRGENIDPDRLRDTTVGTGTNDTITPTPKPTPKPTAVPAPQPAKRKKPCKRKWYNPWTWSC